MPRGKYPRRPRALDAVAQTPHLEPAAVAQPAPAPVEPRADRAASDLVHRGPPAEIVPIGVATTPSVVVPLVAVSDPGRERKPVRWADHAKSRNIDSLSHDDLRAYAREIGVSRRDCEGLTLDRLRQNAKATLQHNIEQILG